MALPWTLVDAVPTPDGTLELRRRGADDFLISVDGRVVMNSRASRSEEALGRLGCAALTPRPGARVLVGGLGMGFTLRAALDALPEDARFVVAELNPAVLSWCRGPLAGLTECAAADHRVEVCLEDVALPIRQAATGQGARFDAILLDLYEGPAPGAPPRDHPHYGREALARCRRALVPGGVLAIWSEDPDPGFTRAPERAGFDVRHERPGRGGRRHVVYLATCRPAARASGGRR
jgi:spermidine synthase